VSSGQGAGARLRVRVVSLATLGRMKVAVGDELITASSAYRNSRLGEDEGKAEREARHLVRPAKQDGPNGCLDNGQSQRAQRMSTQNAPAYDMVGLCLAPFSCHGSH